MIAFAAQGRLGCTLRLLAAVVLLGLGSSPPVHAASLRYAVRAWTIEDGLPTSTVQDIAQTPDGYLWLATTGGLARFDGVRFEVFGLAQGLSTNRFQGLAVDRSGAASARGTPVRCGRRPRCSCCRTVGYWAPLTTITGSAANASPG